MAGLPGAASGIRGRIEKEDNRTTRQVVAQRASDAILVEQGKAGGEVSGAYSATLRVEPETDATDGQQMTRGCRVVLDLLA